MTPGRARGGIARNPTFLAGAGLLAAAATAALFAPHIARWDPLAVDLAARLLPPGGAHPLGTDESGRDVLARLLHGARLSLVVGLLARAIATAVGVTLGVAAGYRRGLSEAIIMRLTDLVLAFPSLLLLIAIATAFGGGFTTLFLTIGFAGWGATARLVRAQVLAIRDEEFVAAARASGAGPLRIIARHVLPNCQGPVIVSFTLGVASAILAEASLSFLGLGAKPPAPSWGGMAQSGAEHLLSAPWLALAPAAAIAVVVLGWNLLGDALSGALAPESRGTAEGSA